MSTMLEKVNYIAGIKNNIGEAITAKGGEITNDFDSYATAITNLPSGALSETAIDFVDLGWKPTDLYVLNKDLTYSKECMNKWNPENNFKLDKNLIYAPYIDPSKITTLEYMYHECDSLLYVPFMDTSKFTSMYYMFYNCKEITKIPFYDTTNVTDMGYVFNHCTSLLELPNLNTSKVTNMEYAFAGCASLKKIPVFDTSKVKIMSSAFAGCSSLVEFPELDTSNVTSFQNMFSYCTSLVKINCISIKKSSSDVNNMFYGDVPIQYMLIKDLGIYEFAPQYDFTKLVNWGSEYPQIPQAQTVDLKGARQAVRDTLLKYSFDRNAAGYETCTIKLPPSAETILTKDQIAAIQNKGYTVTIV